MDLSDVLEKRLKQKGLTRYKMAKMLAEADAKKRPVTSFTTRVNKVVEDPRGRVFSNIEEFINALGGKIVIRWTDTTDEEL